MAIRQEWSCVKRLDQGTKQSNDYIGNSGNLRSNRCQNSLIRCQPSVLYCASHCENPIPQLLVGGILKAYRVGFCGAIYFFDLSSLDESVDEAGLFQNQLVSSARADDRMGRQGRVLCLDKLLQSNGNVFNTRIRWASWSVVHQPYQYLQPFITL